MGKYDIKLLKSDISQLISDSQNVHNYIVVDYLINKNHNFLRKFETFIVKLFTTKKIIELEHRSLKIIDQKLGKNVAKYKHQFQKYLSEINFNKIKSLVDSISKLLKNKDNNALIKYHKSSFNLLQLNGYSKAYEYILKKHSKNTKLTKDVQKMLVDTKSKIEKNNSYDQLKKLKIFFNTLRQKKVLSNNIAIKLGGSGTLQIPIDFNDETETIKTINDIIKIYKKAKHTDDTNYDEIIKILRSLIIAIRHKVMNFYNENLTNYNNIVIKNHSNYFRTKPLEAPSDVKQQDKTIDLQQSLNSRQSSIPSNINTKPPTRQPPTPPSSLLSSPPSQTPPSSQLPSQPPPSSQTSSPPQPPSQPPPPPSSQSSQSSSQPSSQRRPPSSQPSQPPMPYPLPEDTSNNEYLFADMNNTAFDNAHDRTKSKKSPP